MLPEGERTLLGLTAAVGVLWVLEVQHLLPVALFKEYLACSGHLPASSSAPRSDAA